MSTEREDKRRNEDLIAWRKEKTFTLWSKGWSQSRIANELKVTQGTISNDLDYLLKQSQSNLKDHLHENIPRQWSQCLQGIKTVMAESWNIYDSISNDNNVKISDKTNVLALIKDCYKHLLDLNADSTIVSECINFSKRANNKLEPLRLQPPHHHQQPPPQQGHQQQVVDQVDHDQDKEQQEVEQTKTEEMEEVDHQ